MAAGAVALLRPTDLIIATGDKRVIDGLEFEFQMAPNSEAPAEMHFYVPRYKLLNLAENCTHNFHNLLPFRGADVRDALAWSKYLGEALQMWGGKADAMDTVVGDRGIKLSGGQRQRIAIARAFLKDAPILLLDEATAALDTESEEAIREAISRLVRGRTVIAIAHRLATLRSFDRVVMLQGGQILEDGPPDVLLRGRGPYRELVTREMGRLAVHASAVRAGW